MGEVVALPGVELPIPERDLRLEVFAGYAITEHHPDGSVTLIEEVTEDKEGNTYMSSKDARADGKRQLNWFKKRPEDLQKAIEGHGE